MKKIVLSLASVLAATAFAPEASAIPAFARQTGSACAACHFQSFPQLTAFGKAFKTSGFTMMGAQGKVEGDHGLSIPDTLNMAMFFQARYIKTGGTDVQVGPTEVRTTNSGRIDLPDEFALFGAGRVAENIGAMAEINIGGPVGTSGLAGAKLPIMFDVGSVKLGVVPFTNDNTGPAWGYDQFATGSVANARVTENGGGYSAAMTLGTTGAGYGASGAAIVVANSDFHVSYTPWVRAHAATNSGFTGTALGGNYVRAAWTPSMAGWDLGLGVQNFSGNSLKGVNAVNPTLSRDSATIIDFQGQGEVAAMPLGIYGSYGWADGQAVGAVNTFNAGPERKTSFGLLADLGVIPNTLQLQLGFMRNKTGLNEVVLGAPVVGTNETDNSYTLGVRYKLVQNVKLALAYTKSSGTAYNLGGSSPNALRGAGRGDSLTTVILGAGF